jgi:hypothetical protein
MDRHLRFDADRVTFLTNNTVTSAATVASSATLLVSTPIWVIGDVDGAQTGQAGQVISTAFTTNDTTTIREVHNSLCDLGRARLRRGNSWRATTFFLGQHPEPTSPQAPAHRQPPTPPSSNSVSPSSGRWARYVRSWHRTAQVHRFSDSVRVRTAPRVDWFNRPRPSGGKSANNAVGFAEFHDFGIQDTSVFPSGQTSSAKLIGPGDNDIWVPVDAVSTTIAIQLNQATGYGGTTYATATIWKRTGSWGFRRRCRRVVLP